MTAGNLKTPRLLAAAKEFNIGKETLLDFLKSKGFDVKDNPASKISEEMYDSLHKEFAKDKAAKQKSDEIALPKGASNIIESLHKDEAPLDNAKEKKLKEKTTKAKATEEKTDEVPKVSKPEVAPEAVAPEKETMSEPEVDKKPLVAETPAPSAPEEIKEEVTVNEPVKKETTKPLDTEADNTTTPAPKADVPVSTTPADDASNASPTEGTNEEAEHIETSSPKLQGPKIINKIDLSEINMQTRPKKSKDNNNKDKKKTSEAPKPASKEPYKAPTTASDARKEHADAPKKPANKPPKEEIRLEHKELITEVTFEPQKPEEDREHIDLNAPKLEGPKILGKIELPVGTQSGRQERKEKRKRKRIPVEKKPEPKAGGNTNTGNTTGKAPYQNNRNQKPGTGNNNAAGYGNKPGYGNRPNNNNTNRNNKFAPKGTPVQQEIDAKEIQEKIRETQAKLAGGGAKTKNLKAKYRRNKREEMAEKRAASELENDGSVLQVTEFISVSEFANLLDVPFTDVISKCMSLGIMVSINQRLDAEVIELVASEFDREVEFINLDSESGEEETIFDNPDDLVERAPVVTIMGHVDHGKTSLLDYIRSASVVAGEAGGITQHIGAYKVATASGKEIAFLDTPGHEAFTAMRARGAKAADVAVIVVAADDAIMPQTKEAISHAQAAGLPMIFAINKIDKEAANPEKIKEQLASMNILVEDWGGKFQSQEISAKKGLNIDLLLEKIILEAELLDLKANPNREADGSVIEASLDKGRGYVSTILVQGGTLHQGDMLVSGQFYGKVKAMFNERGQKVAKAGPSTPVQVLGLNGAPQAGEKVKVYADETEAKNVAIHRSQILREQGLRSRKHITLDEIGRRLALGNFKELNVIIRADVDGSAEALSDSLQKLSTDEVVVNVVHKGVGQISEGDVNLASASDAIILGFQVRPSAQAARLADQENIEIRYYSVIYDAIGEIKAAMEGLLEPTIEKKIVGNIEVRDTFKISGVGTIAGCYVLDGKFTRNTKINVIRDGIVVHTGELSSLKRFKDDVKEVNFGYECGLTIKNYNDIQVNDIIEGYEEVEVKRKLA